MAIIKTTSPGLLRTAAGATILTVGPQGQQVMRAPTTNKANNGPGVMRKASAVKGGTTRSNKLNQGTGNTSTQFQSLNNSITQLDAAYELLTPAQQGEWITYAANIAGEWGLCANCQPDSAAKKLYRQYNFNRQAIGAGTVNVPIDATEICDGQFGNCYWQQAGLSSFVSYQGTAPTALTMWVMVTTGQAKGNVVVPVSQAAFLTNSLPGTADYNSFVTIANALGWPTPPPSSVAFPQCCYFTTNGAPGLPNNPRLYTFAF